MVSSTNIIWWRRPLERKMELRPPKYFMLTFEEFIRLIICVVFDIVEFAVPILLGPIVGDALDIVGFWTSISLFGWVGCLSILELVPGADYFPVFVLTWTIWYYRKKMREKIKREKMRKKWM